MNFDKFLDNYWSVFISHISEYYAFDKDFLSKYGKELNWAALSCNKNLEWTLQFLEQYEDYFSWSDLARNPSIKWEVSLIERFKKRVDWFYLNQNNNLPLTEEFKEKYHNKVDLSDEPFTWESPDDYAKNKERGIEHFLKNMGDMSITNSKIFYDEYIFPHFSSKGIEEIFAHKFDYSQRFFFLRPVQNDIYGLTPEFEFKKRDPFSLARDDRGIVKIPTGLTLVNGSLQEGPARLLEIPRLSHSLNPVLLISENVKRILERFKLPKHSFTSVVLKPKKINTRNQFYIFQMEHDTLTKDIDFENTRLKYRYKYGYFSSNYSDWIDFEEKIKNYGQLKETLAIKRTTAERTDVYVEWSTDSMKIKSDYDIYTFWLHNKFIVTEHLQKALDDQLPNQVDFRSAQLLNIRQNQEIYDAMSMRKFEFENIKPVSFTKDSEDRFYSDKMQRLLSEKVDFPDSDLKDDEFTSIQKQLRVLLPEKFKRAYRKAIINDEFSFLPINNFYIENGYAERYPETYKALIFAENGFGDSLGLVLDKKSDFKLRTIFYIFLHETGEVEKF